MQFIKHDLGQLSGGETAEVTITSAANVRLLDSHNFIMYRSGRRFDSTGGHYEQSPVRFFIPHFGHWYVVVDLGGYAGEVSSSARILSEEPFQADEAIR